MNCILFIRCVCTLSHSPKDMCLIWAIGIYCISCLMWLNVIKWDLDGVYLVALDLGLNISILDVWYVIGCIYVINLVLLHVWLVNYCKVFLNLDGWTCVCLSTVRGKFSVLNLSCWPKFLGQNFRFLELLFELKFCQNNGF